MPSLRNEGNQIALKSELRYAEVILIGIVAYDIASNALWFSHQKKLKVELHNRTI